MGHFVRSKSTLQFFPVADQGISCSMLITCFFFCQRQVGGTMLRKPSHMSLGRNSVLLFYCCDKTQDQKQLIVERIDFGSQFQEKKSLSWQSVSGMVTGHSHLKPQVLKEDEARNPHSLPSVTHFLHQNCTF